MAQFRYILEKHMEPRPGNTYATIYYHQTPDQRDDLLNHVRSVITEILAAAQHNPEDMVMLQQPLPGFRRIHKPNYSAVDIMSDLLTQLQAGRDLTQGLLGRWNRLFGSTAASIEVRSILQD